MAVLVYKVDNTKDDRSARIEAFQHFDRRHVERFGQSFGDADRTVEGLLEVAGRW